MFRKLLLSEKSLLIKFIYHIVDLNKQHTATISRPHGHNNFRLLEFLRIIKIAGVT